jgi:hypothetical protein
MSEALYLREDVYFCLAQGYGVFLDLERDKYSAVVFPSNKDAHAEAAGAAAPAAADLVAMLSTQRDTLIEAGLLTTDARGARPIGGAPIQAVESHAFWPDDQRAFGLAGPAAEGLRIGLADLRDFFFASWKASQYLRTRHISTIVGAVRRRKAQTGAQATDWSELRRSTAIFRRLRPWYPRKYLCLYDSLALIEFLARRRLHPLWVFAVQAQPFGAHCWVQHEGLLLNEGTEYAGQFTPIMAV